MALTGITSARIGVLAARVKGVLVAGLALVALTGCSDADGGGDDDEGRSEPNVATAPTTPEPELSTQEDEVLAAYEAAVDVLGAAFAVPDPEHPDLPDHWAGEALMHVQASLENLKLNGQAVEGAVESNAVVQINTWDDETAWVVDCFVERAQRVDADTREPVSEVGETVVSTKERLERIDGVWKIVKNEHQEVDGCTPG